MVELAYIRGGNVRFIILPDMLKKAPFFDRITIWRKFKGHAVLGLSTQVGRGQGGGPQQRPGGRGGFGGPGGPGHQGMGMGGRGMGGLGNPTAGPIGRGASAVIPAWQLAQQAHQQAKQQASAGQSNPPAFQQQPQQQQFNPYAPSGRGAGGPQGSNIYGAGRY